MTLHPAAPRDLLGIFPAFGEGLLGGIEASAVPAWQAAAQFATTQGMGTHLLCYGRAPENAHEFRSTVFAPSQTAALRAAVTSPAQPAVVLVWHLGLLKLLPPLLRFRPKVLLYLHGIEAWRPFDPLTRFLFRFVSTFVTNSRYTWERFLQHQPGLAHRQHVVVPLGLGEPIRETVPAPAKLPQMLMLSRLSAREDYKGHREMIAAWSQVRQQVPGARLVIAGEGDLRPALENLVSQHALADAVHFTGRVPEAEKQQLLRASCALAMPSRNEGFGLVYLEAMRLGRPCLVSSEDAGREVVNPPETGLSAHLGDSAALVQACVRLLTPGANWEAWSAAAKQRYEQQFTAAQFQARLRAVLEQAL